MSTQTSRLVGRVRWGWPVIGVAGGGTVKRAVYPLDVERPNCGTRD